jgi:hypothetical protein
MLQKNRFVAQALALLVVGTFLARLARGEETPAGYATPALAYEAFAKAKAAGDWKAAWACLTPPMQDAVAFESLFQLGMRDPQYEEKYLKPEYKNLAEVPKDEAEQVQLFVSMIRDKVECYAAVCVLEARSEDRPDWKAPLRKVVIARERAQGVVTRHSIHYERYPGKPIVKVRTEYDAPVYFQKTAAGWLLDNATLDEVRKHAAAISEPPAAPEAEATLPAK